MSVSLINRHAVAVTGWLRDDQKFQVSVRIVQHLMRHVGRHCDALMRVQLVLCAVQFKQGNAPQNKKELTCRAMIMPDFGCVRGHSFVNHAERRIFDEMPAIANLAPDVMFGGVFANHHAPSIDAGQFDRQFAARRNFAGQHVYECVKHRRIRAVNRQIGRHTGERAQIVR